MARSAMNYLLYYTQYMQICQTTCFCYSVSQTKNEFGQNPEENIILIGPGQYTKILTGSLTKKNRDTIIVKYNIHVYLRKIIWQQQRITMVVVINHAKLWRQWDQSGKGLITPEQTSVSKQMVNSSVRACVKIIKHDTRLIRYSSEMLLRWHGTTQWTVMITQKQVQSHTNYGNSTTQCDSMSRAKS